MPWATKYSVMDITNVDVSQNNGANVRGCLCYIPQQALCKDKTQAKISRAQRRELRIEVRNKL